MYIEISDYVEKSLRGETTEYKDTEIDLVDSVVFIDGILEDTTNDKFDQINCC